jgi:hypothetical protein
MNLHDFFKELNYTLNEEASKYIDSLNEVNLKLLVKRVYESSDLVRNELNRQIKLTEYKNVQDLVSNLNRDETVKFIHWMSENIFASNQAIEDELEKILVK